MQGQREVVRHGVRSGATDTRALGSTRCPHTRSLGLLRGPGPASTLPRRGWAMAGGAPRPDWGVGHYERTAEMLLPAARVLVDTVSPSAGDRLLDLGAGTGNVALLAAESGCLVTAVDPSPRLLSVAAAAAEQRGIELRCKAGEAAALPAAAGSFDCVLSNFAVIFAPDPDAAVAEVARVLRRGGRVGFTAWLPGGALAALAAAAQGLVLSALGAPPPPPGFPWHEAGRVAELVGRHGLTLAVAEQHELVVTATSPRDYLDAEQQSHPLAVAGFEVLRGAGRHEEARERLLQVLEEHNEGAPAFRSTSGYVVFVAEKG